MLFTPGLTFSGTWLCHAGVLVTPGLTLKDDCMVVDETVTPGMSCGDLSWSNKVYVSFGLRSDRWLTVSLFLLIKSSNYVMTDHIGCLSDLRMG